MMACSVNDTIDAIMMSIGSSKNEYLMYFFQEIYSVQKQSEPA